MQKKILLIIVCSCLELNILFAQTFVRVSSPSMINEHDTLILASQPFDKSASYFMKVQVLEGGNNTIGKAMVALSHVGDTIQVTPTDSVAQFEMRKYYAGWSLYDITNKGVWTYNKDGKSNTQPIYIYSEGEIPARYSCYFVWTEDKESWLCTKYRLQKKNGFETCFWLSMKSDNSEMCLSDRCNPLVIYKKLQPKKMYEGSRGEWMFSGQWSVQDLLGHDFSSAPEIDFTQVDLPDFRAVFETEGNKSYLPAKGCITYVKKGNKALLPATWPNVLEWSAEEGIAVEEDTRSVFRMNDAMSLGLKYDLKTDGYITYTRTVAADGGWNTLMLPFPADSVIDTDYNRLHCERMTFTKVTPQGVVLKRVDDDEAWKAGVPYLWRLKEQTRDVRVFFVSSQCDVVHECQHPVEEGLYGNYTYKKIASSQEQVYMLSPDGDSFVRADAGSYLLPWRAFLYLPQGNATVKLLINPGEVSRVNGLREMKEHDYTVYRMDGMKQGLLKWKQPVPQSWPKGVYLSPWGKIIH